MDIAAALAWSPAGYHWQLSLVAALGIAALTFIGGRLALLVPAFRAERARNRAARDTKMAKPHYAANQAWNRRWGRSSWWRSSPACCPSA